MATFNQWKRLFLEENEVKRLTYLCGPDRVLVEEIVDSIRHRIKPHDLDYAHVSAQQLKLKELLALLNQYPLDVMRKRLVVVRDVEHIKKWEGVLDWLMSRHIPQTLAIFIDNRHETDNSQPHMDRIVKSGRYVKCGPFNEEDAISYFQGKASITKSAAKLLFERTGGDLRLACDALNKAALFKGTVEERVVTMLTELSPADDFVESLLRLDKKTAMRAIEQLTEDDISRIIGTLDYRLGLLHRMHSAMQRRQPIRELIANTRIPAFLVKQMLDYAKHYDRPKVRACLDVLGFADTHFQHGARAGLLEVVVATW